MGYSSPGLLGMVLQRAVQGQQGANFSPKWTKMVLDACLRADDPENGNHDLLG